MQYFEGTKRLFLALWPDESIRQQLVPLIPANHGRGVKPHNVHITLVFLGNMSYETAGQLIARIDKLHPRSFSLTLDTIEYIPRTAILWAGMQEAPEELKSLVKSLRKCARKQGIKVETRSYKPHVTLARKVKYKPDTQDAINIHWDVDHFVLVESCPVERGVEYKVVHTWKLQS